MNPPSACESFRPPITLPVRAVEIYGAEAQLWVAVGEFGELLDAMADYRRGRCDANHVAEEIADAEIMLEQLKVIFNCYREVCDWKLAKLWRLAKNLVKEMDKRNDHQNQRPAD